MGTFAVRCNVGAAPLPAKKSNSLKPPKLTLAEKLRDFRIDQLPDLSE